MPMTQWCSCNWGIHATGAFVQLGSPLVWALGAGTGCGQPLANWSAPVKPGSLRLKRRRALLLAGRRRVVWRGLERFRRPALMRAWGLLLGFGQAMLPGVDGGLGAIADTEFGENITDVTFHCLLADMQTAGNILVAETFCH